MTCLPVSVQSVLHRVITVSTLLRHAKNRGESRYFHPNFPHLSSDVVTCHQMSHYQLFPTSQNHPNFAKSKPDNGEIGPQHAVNVAQQSDHRRILCSNEQSKLCLRPTKSLLSDEDHPALPHGRGIRSKVADSGRE